MKPGSLGRLYSDGDLIVGQGEEGTSMFVIQEGQVDVLIESAGRQIWVRTLGEHDFFGEMALFEGEVRSATVRARGDARILTVDKKTLLRAIQDDPSLAFRMVRMMSERIRALSGLQATGGSVTGCPFRCRSSSSPKASIGMANC
jgi:CRP-like cAMP-binding protein